MHSTLCRLDINDSSWVHFVSSCPNATAFHHPVWAELLADCYGFCAFALPLIGEDKEIKAGLPFIETSSLFGKRSWISLPFTDHCQPLAKDASVLPSLTSALVEYQLNNGVNELQVRSSVLDGMQVPKQVDAVIHTLTLKSDASEVFRTFKRTQVQQSIIKAEREGVTIRRGNSTTDLEIFYNLQLMTRRRLGTPVQPRRFFELLWKRLIEPELGFLLLAYIDQKPIAGAIFLGWNKRIIYKYSASDTAYWHHRPNNMLLWAAIRFGCENGYHTFDFGRTDLENQGLRDFKNGWGTREEPLVYSAIPRFPRPRSNTHLNGWMHSVIRNSPAWVCELLGELFYRYAA